jgi:CRISPR-associated protein Csd1
MMLRALYDLAQREGLLDDPDFEKRRVDFLVHVDDRGRFLALVPTVDEKGRAKELAVPRQPKRTVKIAAGFFFDNAKYALGIGPEGKSDARVRECTDAFRTEVAACAEATGDEGAAALARFLDRLDDERPKLFTKRPAKEWTGSEWIAFVRDADGTKPIHERRKVRAHWTRLRAGAGGDDAGRSRCLVTGAVVSPALTHPNVKRVPQAQTSGAALVSFNCDAFESHGLTQGQNAPISREAAEGYVTALNWLLEPDGGRFHRYGVRLGEEAVTVFWTRERSDAPDLVGQLLAPSPEDAEKIVSAPRRGALPNDADATPFYAATLSGNAARVVVRDWFESTAAEVKENVAQYFEDLRLGAGEARPMPIFRLLKALESPSGSGISPAAEGKLFRAAVRGEPFPRDLLGAALRRLRIPPGRQETPFAQREALHARCAVIKATLIRNARVGSNDQEVTVSLDVSNKKPAYLLGRLFAVLERLQAAAQGDLSATIRDRWFGAASATPALAFPRLLRLSVHHASKAERSGWLEKLKGQILSALDAKPFPKMLTLDDQGLFAIGYYHQREKFFEKRVEAGTEPATSEAQA